MATRKPMFNKLTKPKKRGKQWLVDNGYGLQSPEQQSQIKNNNFGGINTPKQKITIHKSDNIRLKLDRLRAMSNSTARDGLYANSEPWDLDCCRENHTGNGYGYGSTLHAQINECLAACGSAMIGFW